MKLQTNLKQEKASVFTITIKIDPKELGEVKKEAIKELSTQIEVKGFRKGEAPQDVVEKKIDKNRLHQLMVQKIASQGYTDVVKDNNLKPAIPPQVSLKSTNEDQCWEIELRGCQAPEADISSVEEEIKKVSVKEKIWTPEKGQKTEGQEVDDQQKKDLIAQKIIQAIIEKTKINIPEMLMEYEMNKRLTELVDQVQSVGLTVEKYLTSKSLSLDQIKDQYQKQITANWKLDLALEELANKYKVVVEEKDLEKYQKTNINPYLAAKVVRREKTLEKLMTL